MENRNSSLWIGLGVGSVIGALVYRFSRTSKAKKLKEKVCDAFHKITGQAEDMLDEAGEKVADTGKAVVDKVADKASEFAGKADEFKGKVHTVASEVKK
ncbi:YtxH domain-containing protein [Bacteroides rodentium]|jgi:gas vesicle protein|uniref:YtxH domain-containing protein n=1 Tax=Bacteroides rodentium TaxID=691816 RepID=UPI00046E65C2|nr:YtxH domain-containing protein [Bacteroides rodentium]